MQKYVIVGYNKLSQRRELVSTPSSLEETQAKKKAFRKGKYAAYRKLRIMPWPIEEEWLF